VSDQRRIAWLLAAGVAVVYGLVIAEVARAEYSLIDDYRAFALIHMGAARVTLLQTLVDWRAPDAWLYRPFPDAISYSLAVIFRHHPGAWRALLIVVRLLCVLVAFRIARAAASTIAAACAATAYFAFFPAIPELHLLRVEGWLVLVVSIALLGWIRLERGGETSLAATAVAFVLATASKEIMAPILILLLALLARHFWRRGGAARAMLAVMTAAVLFQTGRFALLFRDPYARGGSGIAHLAHNALWAAKTLLLATSSFPLLSLVVVLWLIAGADALRRAPRVYAAGLAAMIAASLALALAAPYDAIRYLYPTALLLVPLLAMPRQPDRVAAVLVVFLMVFGGAQLVAQAASTRACSRADWRLLREQAAALSNGRDVVVIEDADFERGLWMRAELAGVDPRWPFLTYVAQQYAGAKPVVWPPPPAGPVNLTELVQPRGRFMTVPPSGRVAGDALIVDANPLVIPAGFNVGAQIDFRSKDALAKPLDLFRRGARVVNPKFRYSYDLGEVPFPGYSWPMLQPR
jgi:hypothetical protein